LNTAYISFGALKCKENFWNWNECISLQSDMCPQKARTQNKPITRRN
jgi:hypothetical protein